MSPNSKVLYPIQEKWVNKIVIAAVIVRNSNPN
jgi:hypothetical protein